MFSGYADCIWGSIWCKFALSSSCSCFAPVGVLGWSPSSLNFLRFHLTHLVVYTLWSFYLENLCLMEWASRSVDFQLAVRSRFPLFSFLSECRNFRGSQSALWGADQCRERRRRRRRRRQHCSAQQAGASAGGPRAREAAQLGTTASRPDQELVPRIHKVSRISFLFFLSFSRQLFPVLVCIN